MNSSTLVNSIIHLTSYKFVLYHGTLIESKLFFVNMFHQQWYKYMELRQFFTHHENKFVKNDKINMICSQYIYILRHNI